MGIEIINRNIVESATVFTKNRDKLEKQLKHKIKKLSFIESFASNEGAFLVMQEQLINESLVIIDSSFETNMSDLKELYSLGVDEMIINPQKLPFSIKILVLLSNLKSKGNFKFDIIFSINFYSGYITNLLIRLGANYVYPSEKKIDDFERVIKFIYDNKPELQSYDRKLKNAVTKSIIELLQREGVILSWDMARHQLQAAELRSKQIKHLNDNRILENLHSDGFVKWVATLFQGTVKYEKEKPITKCDLNEINWQQNKNQQKTHENRRKKNNFPSQKHKNRVWNQKDVI